jgi:DNA-binding MarR family transcriptional regulator
MTERPGDNAAIEEFADALMTIAHHLELRGGAGKEIVPLTGSESAVIREVYRHPRTTPTRIAALTGMQRSNISTAIKLLEARGMLTRESPSGDGRSVELIATDLAAENVQRIRQYWVDRLRTGSLGALLDSVEGRTALVELADSLRD